MLYRGILSIKDPRGMYIGSQNIARAFLYGIDIDISYLGPKERPNAVVIAINDLRERNQPNAPVTHVKADYFKNSPQDLFNALLSKSETMFRVDKLKRQSKKGYPGGSTYYLYCNNGLVRELTKEEFFQEECSFEYVPEPETPASST